MEPISEAVCQDLNGLLKGCHMGADVYQEYLASAKDPMLKSTLIHALDIFKKHEIELTQRINERHTDAADSVSIMAAVESFFEKLKTVMLDDDKKILDAAINAIGMGINACDDFKDRHHGLDEVLLNAVEELEKDYKLIYADLTAMKLN